MFVSVRISISLPVCIYVLPVTSLLSAFVLYLFWLCSNKTIKVIHCFYPLKNPCTREESLQGILSLEIKPLLVVIRNLK